MVKNLNDQEAKKEQPEDEEKQKEEECFPQTEKKLCLEQIKVSETTPFVSSDSMRNNTSSPKNQFLVTSNCIKKITEKR